MEENQTGVPDFSGDDFINDKGIQKTRKEAEAERVLIEQSLDIIQTSLNVKRSGHKNLKSFFMFKSLEPILTDSFSSSNPSFPITVSVAEYTSSYSTPRHYNAGADKYLFGHLALKNSFPSTYCCKETIREKITDLFLKTDTDFTEHRKFSRYFHVVTKDSKKLTDLLTIKDLNELTSFPDMEIEILNNSCLFRNSRRRISPDEAIQFCEMAKTLWGILN